MKFHINRSLLIIFLCSQFFTSISMNYDPSDNASSNTRLNIHFNEQAFDSHCTEFVEASFSYNNNTLPPPTGPAFNAYHVWETQQKWENQQQGWASAQKFLKQSEKEYREKAAWEAKQRERELEEMAYAPRAYLNTIGNENLQTVYEAPNEKQQSYQPIETDSRTDQQPEIETQTQVENSNQDSDNPTSQTPRFQPNPAAIVRAEIPIFDSTLQTNANNTDVDQNSDHFQVIYTEEQQSYQAIEADSDTSQQPETEAQTHGENSDQDSDSPTSQTPKSQTNPASTVRAEIPIFDSTLQINSNTTDVDQQPTNAPMQPSRRLSSWPTPGAPSFDGLDNIPFLGPTETERRETEYRDTRIRTELKNFLTNQTIPESYKHAIQEISHAYTSGELPLEEAEQQYNTQFVSYKNERLNELRLKDELTNEELQQRRALEDECLNEQTLPQSYIEEKEKLEQEYEDETEHTVFFWDIFTNKLQNIQTHYEERHTQLRNQLLDNISEKYKQRHIGYVRQCNQRILNRLARNSIEFGKQFAINQRQYQPVFSSFWQSVTNIFNLQPYYRYKKPFEKAVEHLQKKHCSTNNEKRSQQPISLENCGTIIPSEEHEPLDAANRQRSVDFVVTKAGDGFLKEIGIDPVEFNNFNGTKKQNELHQRLLHFINNVQNFVISDDSELATKLREIMLTGFKAAYALNQRNCTNLGLELLIVCEKVSIFTIFPTRTITKEFINTLQDPKTYLEKRIDNLIDTIHIVNKLIYDFSALTVKEKFSKIYTKVINIKLDTAELFRKFNSKTIKQHEEEFAKQAVDIVFDTGILTAAKAGTILAKSSKDAFKAARHMIQGHHAKRIANGSITNYIESEINVIIHPATSSAVQKTPNVLLYQKILVSKICKKINSKFKHSISKYPIKPPLLRDFKQVSQNFNFQKSIATRSKPYQACKDVLLKRQSAIAKERLEETKKVLQQFAEESSTQEKVIWSKIEPTQEFWPNSNIPKSFIIECKNKKIWVSANATDHLREYVVPTKAENIELVGKNKTPEEYKSYINPVEAPWDIPAKRTKHSQEMVLTDFYEGLEKILQKEITFNSKGRCEILTTEWEMVFSKPKIEGGKIELFHIKKLAWKNK